jgi:hypothetical protein
MPKLAFTLKVSAMCQAHRFCLRDCVEMGDRSVSPGFHQGGEVHRRPRGMLLVHSKRCKKNLFLLRQTDSHLALLFKLITCVVINI